MTDPLDLDALEALAKAADDDMKFAWFLDSLLIERGIRRVRAEFIAATDPGTVLQLIKELREARAGQADAWDEGFQAGWEECEQPEAFVNDFHDAKTPNPYGSTDDRA